MLSQVKLIAEPWDLGEGGYQVGNFPVGWTEWNGTLPRHRARASGRATAARSRELATRLAGSQRPLRAQRPPAVRQHQLRHRHDGFTLHDLVSYDEKHNEANGEDNRDGDRRQPAAGTAASRGRPTTRHRAALRAQQKRNFLATLLLSQGVPMLLAGDEMGRTQRGNNNAYCQDNEISWIDWDLDERRQGILELRPADPRDPARRTRSCAGAASSRGGRSAAVKDIAWLQPSGKEMTDDDWQRGFARCLGALLVGDAIDEVDEDGNPVRDDTLLLLLNGHHAPRLFTLAPIDQSRWETLLDTSETVRGEAVRWHQHRYRMAGRSLALLVARNERRRSRHV